MIFLAIIVATIDILWYYNIAIDSTFIHITPNGALCKYSAININSADTTSKSITHNIKVSKYTESRNINVSQIITLSSSSFNVHNRGCGLALDTKYFLNN